MKKTTKYIAVGSLIFLFSACGVIKGSKNWFVNKIIKTIDVVYEDDCPAEEFLEDQIEELTGLTGIDLTPATPE